MTRPEEVKQQILIEWLRKADMDLGLAKHLMSEMTIFPNAIVFHCQQASEKYIKAFLIWRDVDFPKTHDLEDLLNLVETTNQCLASRLRDVVILTPYGVELRYPGDRPDASSAEASEAAHLAQKVRDAVLPLLPGVTEADT